MEFDKRLEIFWHYTSILTPFIKRNIRKVAKENIQSPQVQGWIRCIKWGDWIYAQIMRWARNFIWLACVGLQSNFLLSPWQKQLRVTQHIQWHGIGVDLNLYIWIHFSWVCFVKIWWFDLIFNCPRFFDLIPSYAPALSPQLDEKAQHYPTTCPLKTKTKPCRENDAGANLFQAKTIKGVGNFPFCKQIPTKKGFQNNKIIIQVSEKILYLINALIKYSFPSSMQKVQTRMHN